MLLSDFLNLEAKKFVKTSMNTVLNGKVRPILIPQPFLYKIVFP